MDILRRQVLNAFKDLHRARKTLFCGDNYALEEISAKEMRYSTEMSTRLVAEVHIYDEKINCCLAFFCIHRNLIRVYHEDSARQKINAEFKKNKHVKDPLAIQEMVVLSKSVEKELRTSVVQAKEVSPGIYRLNITPETLKLDNVPFKDCGS